MKIKCRPNPKAIRRFKKKWTEYYGYHCAYCTKDCEELSTIDHIVPLSKGGGNTLDNLVMACYRCNQQKGNLSLSEFKPLMLQPIKQEILHVKQ